MKHYFWKNFLLYALQKEFIKECTLFQDDIKIMFYLEKKEISIIILLRKKIF